MPDSTVAAWPNGDKYMLASCTDGKAQVERLSGQARWMQPHSVESTCQSQLNIPCIRSYVQPNTFTGLLHLRMQDYCIFHATNQTLFSLIHTAFLHSSRIYDATLLNHIRAIKHTLSILLLLHLYSRHRHHFFSNRCASWWILKTVSISLQHDLFEIRS